MSCNKSDKEETYYGFCVVHVGCCAKLKWDRVGYTLTECESTNVKEIINATNIIIYK